MPAEAIVVSPLEFERRALHRTGLGALCRLACCGPGPSAVTTWAAAHQPAGSVILCGLAGATRDALPVRSAYAASAIVLEDGRRLEPALDPGREPAAVIGSADRILTTPAAKANWARRTGADLADLESASFARLAAERGWRWAVVRGVSDGPQTALPPDLGAWVDDRGRTRVAAVCRAIARRGATIPQLVRLRADGSAAMRAAASIVRRMLEDPDGP